MSKGRVPPFWRTTVSRFLQQQPHHNVSLCSIFRYSGPQTRFPKPLLSCHRKWFAYIFFVSTILPIHLTTSFQFWSKLLLFLRKVTYFVLAKQICYTSLYQNSIVFLRRISTWRRKVGSLCWRAGRYDLTSYGNSKKELIVKYPYLFWQYEISHLTYSGKITTYSNIDRMSLNLLTTSPKNRGANHLQWSWWHQSSTLGSDCSSPDTNIGTKWTTGPHWDRVALMKTVLCQKGSILP